MSLLSNGTDTAERLVKQPVDKLDEDCQRDLAVLRAQIDAEYDGACREVSLLTDSY